MSGRYSIYFTGIGGTGVVTAAHIIASAAETAGLSVSGLDQTGLSQKAGAVVSQLHLAKDPGATGAVSSTTGSADLYLSGDILQAAAARHLARVSPGRTRAVIDSQITPTAAMLQTDREVPAADMRQIITERGGADLVTFLDSKRLAEAVFADHLLANVILIGAAFQLGGLPLSLADIGRALPDGDNRAAFEWGRWAVHDPVAVEAALAGQTEGTSPFDPSPRALAAVPLVASRDLPVELRDLTTRTHSVRIASSRSLSGWRGRMTRPGAGN
jgi:indolepyruvate ferredoxin oxidoreductase